MLVAIYGPDGAGKSTVIKKLEDAFDNVEIYHFRPSVLPQSFIPIKSREARVLSGRPYSDKKHGYLVSVVKILYTVAEYFFWWIFIKLAPTNSDKIYIFDRYYLDLLIDQKRMMISGHKLIIRLMAFFVPYPDITICLLGAPEKISNRKKELTVAETANLIEGYGQIANSICLDTTVLSLHEVTTRIESIIQAKIYEKNL